MWERAILFTALMFPLDLSKPQVYSGVMSVDDTPSDGSKHTFAAVAPYNTRPLTVESAIVSITAYNRTKEAHGGTVPFDWNIVLTSELMLDVLRRIVKFS